MVTGARFVHWSFEGDERLLPGTSCRGYSVCMHQRFGHVHVCV